MSKSSALMGQKGRGMMSKTLWEEAMTLYNRVRIRYTGLLVDMCDFEKIHSFALFERVAKDISEMNKLIEKAVLLAKFRDRILTEMVILEIPPSQPSKEEGVG